MSFTALAQEEKFEEMLSLLNSNIDDEDFTYDSYDDLLNSINISIENSTERFVKEFLNKVTYGLLSTYSITLENFMSFLDKILITCFKNFDNHVILSLNLEVFNRKFLEYENPLRIAYQQNDDEVMEYLLNGLKFTYEVEDEIAIDMINNERISKLSIILNHFPEIRKRKLIAIAKNLNKPNSVQIISQSLSSDNEEILENMRELLSDQEYSPAIDLLLSDFLRQTGATVDINSLTKEQKEKLMDFIFTIAKNDCCKKESPMTYRNI